MKTKNLVITALLMAFAIIIPVAFGGFLRIIIPPFSATLASHVPIFLSMFLGPIPAIIVALGSSIGFLISFPDPVIAARALMHVGVVLVGATLLKRGVGYWKVMIITAPIHGILESLIVIPFVGFDLYQAFIVVGIGAMIHHMVDAGITRAILPALKLASPSFSENLHNKSA
ncbi:MAG: ECF transporter S component [Clostridium sp.]